MTNTSMWGQLDSESATQENPLEVLRQQAAALSRVTNRRLRATVVRNAASYGGGFEAEMFVTMPRLTDYRFTIVTITYPLAFYPVGYHDHVGNKRFEIANHQHFQDELAETLSSDAVTIALNRIIQHTP